MAQPLALANRPWDDYTQPIRLPDNNQQDEMSDDNPPSFPPHPPHHPSNNIDDIDEGTCLIKLLQSRDPLADLLIRVSFSNNVPQQAPQVDENTSIGNNDDEANQNENDGHVDSILKSLGKLLDREMGETSLLLSSLHGLPLHSTLLLRSVQGRQLMKERRLINLSSSNEIDLNESSPLLKELPNLLCESYGGRGHRASLRLYLLDILESSEHFDAVIKCGNEEHKIHKFLLAHRSDYFRAAFAHAALPTETDNNVNNKNNVQVIEMRDECLSSCPHILKPLLKYCYTLHTTEMNQLLSDPDSIVQVAYSADLLMLPILKEAALDLMVNAVDSSNAPSLLHVAQNLDHDPLRRKCIGHMVKHLGKVAREAPHFTQVIGPKEYDWLKRLAEASTSNPVACGAILTDEREYIAMLSEALDAQRLQFFEASSRQEAENRDLQQQYLQAQQAEAKAMLHHQQPDSVFHLVAKRLRDQVDARRSRLALVEKSLASQARHIEFLDGFLATAASAAAQARMSSQQDAANGNSGEKVGQTSKMQQEAEDGGGESNSSEVNQFLPTYEWQVIKPNQAIPAGLDIRLNISAGIGGEVNHNATGGGGGSGDSSTHNSRRARIPPVWRLKVWIEWMETTMEEEFDDEEGMVTDMSSTPLTSKNRANRYHRQNVQRDTTTGEIEAAIAKDENIDQRFVKVIVSDPSTGNEYHLDPLSTFEPYFFIHQRYLKVVIGERLDELYPKVQFQSYSYSGVYHTHGTHQRDHQDSEVNSSSGGGGRFIPISSLGEAAIP